MQKESQYLPFKLGLVCSHANSKSSTNYLDVVCNKQYETYHRITQASKICNKCATLLMRCVNSIDQCPCCSDSLQILIKQTWICSHTNRVSDQITIKCINNQKQVHEVPFQQKVCKICYEKIRAAFMFSSTCLVCDQKESQVFENIENTMTKSSFYFFETIINQMNKKKCSVQQMKSEIEYYCLAEPRQQEFASKFQNQSKEFGENLPEYHQSKRYQLFPKCTQHRYNPVSLCNGCLVSILNLKTCPYGCPYEKKQAKINKADLPSVQETGFLCLYPKQLKDSQYLEYFCIRHIQQSNKIGDKWQGSLRKIKYNGTQNIVNQFSLYAASIQIQKSRFLYCGGCIGENILTFKTTSSAFLINISQNNKTFTLEGLPNMNQCRSSHSLVLFKEFAYAIGGINKVQNKVLSSCERLNLKQKKWQKIADLQIERSKPSAFQFKGKIYVFGGFTTNQKIWNGQCEAYNPDKNTWDVLPYTGYDSPFITGASFINNSWGLSPQNIIVFGGSNYEMATHFMQEMLFQKNGFKLNYVDSEIKLNYTRMNSALSVMKTQTDSQKIAVFFGGVQQHQSLLSFDAVRLKINKNQVRPLFVYQDISIGSFRYLLRQNASSSYGYMLKKLKEQNLLSKQKIQNTNQNQLLKSDSSLHLLQKMWYGIGKCIVGYNS